MSSCYRYREKQIHLADIVASWGVVAMVLVAASLWSFV